MKLLITLGHNSSAICVDNNGNILCGYEEERLTRIKSDKSFPKKSIEKIFEFYKPNKNEDNILYISHWYDDFNFFDNTKIAGTHRYDCEYVNELQEKYNFKVVSLSSEFTHHDAHAHSAINFRDKESDCYIIVADGFGNNEEVISLYTYKDGEINKFYRIENYENSLGLMYQYATSFVGMKENQDEYKFLAFEPKISSILSNEQIERLQKELKSVLPQFKYKSYSYENDYVNVEKLIDTKENWHLRFQNFCNMFNISEQFHKRILIGFIVQTIIEEYLIELVKFFEMKSVLLVGGIFYNVKLNNRIMKNVDEICVMPISGDQGAALGFLNVKLNDLCIGKRTFYKIEDTENVRYFNDKEKFEQFVIECLKRDEIVQIFCGNMEFGPRALCHTSTICLPSFENTDIINILNNRTNEMPMAPVMLESGYNYFFEEDHIKKIHKSQEFMIITLDYKDDIIKNEFEKYQGVLHKYPLLEKYSGRPQVIYNKHNHMFTILEEIDKIGYKCLINTSWNSHGLPILYSIEDMLHDFNEQMENKEKNSITKKVWAVIGDF